MNSQLEVRRLLINARTDLASLRASVMRMSLYIGGNEAGYFMERLSSFEEETDRLLGVLEEETSH